MQIHEIQGSSIQDALERARDAVGGDAVVVAQRPRSGGGVRLAVAERAPSSDTEAGLLRRRASALLALSPALASGPAPGALADVERCMRAAGASAVFLERVLGALRGHPSRLGHPLDLAAAEIGAAFPLARAERARGSCAVIAFLGASGVGKTTTIAKLGARLVRSGRRTGLVTLDAYRVGAVAQLEAYAELLGVPCRAPRDAAQFVAGLGSLPVFDALLVDTTGAVERDRERLADLAARLPRAYRLRSYLVLSAATDRAALERVTEACAGQELAGCVVTKLDETCTPAPVLEHVLERGLPVAFLSDGPDLAHDFHRPTPEHFADLFLRGRLR